MSVLIKGIELPEKVQVLELHPDGKVFTRKGYLVGEAVELPDKHGRLVDADALRESVLKWLPHDPCGVEENEHPYETDICVSMLMEIEEAPTIVESEDE